MNDFLQRVLKDAEADLDQIVRDVVSEVTAGIAVYGRDGLVPSEDVHRSTRETLIQVIAALLDPSAAEDLRAPEEVGHRRAIQGVPLPEVIQAFRLCAEGLWRRLCQSIRQSSDVDSVDAALAASTALWRLTDAFSVALTRAHRAAAAELLASRQNRRSALAKALFTGEPGPPCLAWEVPNLLGFPSDSDFIVVAAYNTTPGFEALPGIELRLAQRGIASVWQIISARQIGIVALSGTHVDDVVAELDEIARARIGVSPRYRYLSETPRALYLAGVAAASAKNPGSRVNVFDSSPLSGLVAQDHAEGARVARTVLGAILELPRSEREVLLETMRVWFDHDGSTEKAAARLYCHPNTVRNRLRRIQELTGHGFTKPWELAELAVALQASMMSPGDRPRP